MKTIKNLAFALKEIGSTSKYIFVFMTAFALVKSAIAIIDLFLLKWMIDYALSEYFEFPKLLLYLLLYFLVIMLFQTASGVFGNIYIHKFELRIMSKTKAALYRKIETIDLADYSNPGFYDKINRALREVGIRYFQILVDLFALVISIFTSAAVFTYYGDAVIFLATLLNVANYVVYYFIAENYRYRFEKREEEPYNRFHAYMERVFYLPEYAGELRMLDGLKERLMSRDEEETGRYLGRYRIFLRTFFGQATLMTAVSNLIFALVSVYVSGLLFQREISVGEFIVAISVVTSMTDNLVGVIKTIPGFYHSGLLVGDIREVLEYPSAFAENEAGIRADFFENLTADRVSFQYEGTTGFKIHDLNFTVSKNQVIAVAGQNGSGKSTIMDIIMALLPAQSGRLLMNGLPYEDYNLSSLRNMFGVVFQDFRMYEVSVAENILMREVRSEEDIQTVKEALQFVGLYEKVMAMPQGMDTVLAAEENGVCFSGGERQKLAIARAYAKPAPILLFDEPASALDVFAAEAFYADLFRMKEIQKRTIVYTTHRLEHTVHADRILYIHNGTVSESGTHQELLAQNGEYAYLYRLREQCERTAGTQHGGQE